MRGKSIVVFTIRRQSQRQIARALHSAGTSARFVKEPGGIGSALDEARPDLVILDGDSPSEAMEASLNEVAGRQPKVPVILLSIANDKRPFLELIRQHDISNLVAKHGAIRAVFPVLDERELLVTCEKVLRRDIFGIEKYVGSWGIRLHHHHITGLSDKPPFLAEFEKFLGQLDCPAAAIPGILTVADELIINAVVHAPHGTDDKPKYEHLGPKAAFHLQPNEYVDVAFGCDGQRLMLSVSDNFGRLRRDVLYHYLDRGFDAGVELEDKPSGAGLGLSLAFRSMHQLIFNIQERHRTEVIAGWYLRVNSNGEFKQVAKSLNVFWLPAGSRPIDDEVVNQCNSALPPWNSNSCSVSAQAAGTPLSVEVALVGRIDESTDLTMLSSASALDLTGITAITSRGIVRWCQALQSRGSGAIQIRNCPEALVMMATQISGSMDGADVRTVLAPYECSKCQYEEQIEMPPANLIQSIERICPRCGQSLNFAGVRELYQAFAEKVTQASVPINASSL